MTSLAVAVSFMLAQAPAIPNSPYVADLPYTLTVYAIEQGRPISDEPRPYPVPVDSISACMGAGVPAVIAHWVGEHPKEVVLRTTCRMGAPATERPA